MQWSPCCAHIYDPRGPALPALEKTVADYCGAKHAVVVNSATSALHIACLALGVGKGDSVWTTPITFVAGMGHVLIPVFENKFKSVIIAHT